MVKPEDLDDETKLFSVEWKVKPSIKAMHQAVERREDKIKLCFAAMQQRTWLLT